MEIELTPDQENQVIPAAVYFLRTLTATLGAEVGLHVWDQINATIGNDIKGKVFFAMLTGQVGTEIIMRGFKPRLMPGQPLPNKIDVIKCIRAMSGMSLKDSKDVADHVFAGIEKRIACDQSDQRGYWVSKLCSLGIDTL